LVNAFGTSELSEISNIELSDTPNTINDATTSIIGN
jgi:hypothetical protein